MPEVDYIVKKLSAQQEAEFSLSQLYKTLNKWFLENRYILGEREYDDKERKNFKIKWNAFKDLDDYTRVRIETNISGFNITTIKKGSKVLNKGKVKISFDAWVEKDYQEKWVAPAINTFLRSLYDKFIAPEKFDRYKEELKDDVYTLYNEIKAFLELNKA